MDTLPSCSHWSPQSQPGPPDHSVLLSCANGRKPQLAQLQNEASPSLNFTVINQNIKPLEDPSVLYHLKQYFCLSKKNNFCLHSLIKLNPQSGQCLHTLGRSSAHGSVQRSLLHPTKLHQHQGKVSGHSKDLIVTDLH